MVRLARETSWILRACTPTSIRSRPDKAVIAVATTGAAEHRTLEPSHGPLGWRLLDELSQAVDLTGSVSMGGDV